MAAKRLTRREIVRKDRIQTFLSGIYEWSSANRSVLATFFGIFLLSILGSYVWQNYQMGRTEEIQVRFGEALEMYHAPVAEETTSEADDLLVPNKYRFKSDEERREEALKGFMTIVENYPSADLGLLARYYTGLIKQEMGQMGTAEEELNFVMENSAVAQTRNLARHLLARMAESKNDRQRATVLLEEILLEAADSFPKDTILLQLAQNHEAAGNAQEAVKIYKRLTTEYPTSEYSQEARVHLDQLEAENN